MSTINAAEKAKKIRAGFNPLMVGLIEEARELATFYNMSIEQVMYFQEIRALTSIGYNLLVNGCVDAYVAAAKESIVLPDDIDFESIIASGQRPWPPLDEEE